MRSVCRRPIVRVNPPANTLQYEDKYWLCYLRGPEGIIVALAEPLRSSTSLEVEVWTQTPPTRRPRSTTGTLFLSLAACTPRAVPRPDPMAMWSKYCAMAGRA